MEERYREKDNTDSVVTAGHVKGDEALTREARVFSGLTLRVYDMPPTVEGYVQDFQPALSVGILVKGAMKLGVRQSVRRWSDQYVHQGDLFLRPPHGEPRELRWRTRDAEPTQMLNVYLHHELLFRVIEETVLDPQRVEFIEYSGFQDSLLLQLGQALYAELQHPTLTTSLYAETAANMLAVHLLHHYTVSGRQVYEPTGGLSRRQVQRVYEFVQEHLRHNLSLSVLAEQLNLSPYHFARLFRQATGESPHQFVLRRRLKRAQVLLETTDTPLVEVAVESGFSNQSYLTTVFKQRLGLTPLAYRRLVR